MKKARHLTSFTVFLDHACAKDTLLSPNPFLVAYSVRTVRTLKGVWELFYRLIQVIIHFSQVEAQGGQQCIPAVVSHAGGLGRSCLAQRTGWRSEGEAALLGGRWKGGREDWSRMEAGTALSPTVGAFLNDQVLVEHLLWKCMCECVCVLKRRSICEQITTFWICVFN